MLRKSVGSFLVLMACAHATASRPTGAQAEAQYAAKDFAACGQTYAARGEGSNAACCFALAGRADEALEQLEKAIASDDMVLTEDSLKTDADFASLRADARWPGVLEHFKTAHARLNAELAHLFEQDQADRQDPSAMNWAEVGPRDTARRARVLQIIDAGGANYSADYFAAAMVFQHGDSPAEIGRAHDLALKAVELDGNNRKAKWLVAASEDRVLMYEKKPQKYGTQFSTDPTGKWVLWPVDGTVTDEQRLALNVPTLAEAKAREAQMNAAAH